MCNNNDETDLQNLNEIDKFLEANDIVKGDVRLTFNAIVDVNTVDSSKKISNQKMAVSILFENYNMARLRLEGALISKYYPTEFLSKFQQFTFIGKSLEIKGKHPSEHIGNYIVLISIS